MVWLNTLCMGGKLITPEGVLRQVGRSGQNDTLGAIPLEFKWLHIRRLRQFCICAMINWWLAEFPVGQEDSWTAMQLLTNMSASNDICHSKQITVRDPKHTAYAVLSCNVE